MEEKLIIQGCKSNDRKCQCAFVDQYSPYLFGVCRRYIKDGERAKDCLQDSLVQILKNIAKYQATGSFKSWAARVTATQCLLCIRKEKKHINFDLDDSPEPFVEECANQKLEVGDVLQFLNTIPEKYRIAINMYIIEGYAHKEIAERLGITEGSSRSLVARGRKMIVREFEETQESKASKLSTIKKIQRLA